MTFKSVEIFADAGYHSTIMALKAASIMFWISSMDKVLTYVPIVYLYSKHER